MQTIQNKIRFETFSDSVFAIAITLLALELTIPKLDNASLLGALHELWPIVPTIITFVLSFIGIAIFWVNHHQLTQVLTVISRRRILWANMLFLLFVTLIPFGTKTLSTNPLHPLAMLTYSLVLLGGSLSFSLLRYVIHRSADEHHFPMRRSLVGPLFYSLAVLAAFVSVWLCYLFLIIPPLYYFLPKSPQS